MAGIWDNKPIFKKWNGSSEERFRYTDWNRWMIIYSALAQGMMDKYGTDTLLLICKARFDNQNYRAHHYSVWNRDTVQIMIQFLTICQSKVGMDVVKMEFQGQEPSVFGRPDYEGFNFISLQVFEEDAWRLAKFLGLIPQTDELRSWNTGFQAFMWGMSWTDARDICDNTWKVIKG